MSQGESQPTPEPSPQPGEHEQLAPDTSKTESAQEGISSEQLAEQALENGLDLGQRLAEAQAKALEMQDAFLRAKAEAENIRRRAQEDISKAHKFAVESFAEALLPVRDSLEMALKIETPSLESLKEGVEMTLKQLSAAFEKNRLVEVNPQPGEKLDPMRHQAISMVAADQEANTIVTVLQKGYMISDRLLRPALVTVSQ
jgi:molecular chaperone GrpE